MEISQAQNCPKDIFFRTQSMPRKWTRRVPTHAGSAMNTVEHSTGSKIEKNAEIFKFLTPKQTLILKANLQTNP